MDQQKTRNIILIDQDGLSQTSNKVFWINGFNLILSYLLFLSMNANPFTCVTTTPKKSPIKSKLFTSHQDFIVTFHLPTAQSGQFVK